MLHRTTLGRHALEALCPSRPNRVACNGCSVSHWDRQTSRGIQDLHMTGPRLGHHRGRGCSVEVPALAWAELVICSSCYMHCKPVQGKLAQLSRLFYAQAEWWRLRRKTTLRRCLGRAGRSLVWLALGPVRRQVLSGKWPVAPPLMLAESATPVAATAKPRARVIVPVPMPPAALRP